jgi:hypothetical protein
MCEFSRNPCEVEVCFLGAKIKTNFLQTNFVSKDIKYLARLWKTKYYYFSLHLKNATSIMHKNGKGNKKLNLKLSKWFYSIQL